MTLDARPLWTNFSKGELSPLIEGRPDLAAFFEGASTIENWLLLRQGGVTRRPGFRFISEVKDSTRDTLLLPFETSVDDAFVVEMGHLYDRFYKNKARLAVEVQSPYPEELLRDVHFTSSVDVLFRFHNLVQQHKTARISDTNWTTLPITYNPPPSFPDDTDISGGTATLTLAATTGTSVIVTASEAIFLQGDVGRIIIFGASRATITDFGASAGDTTSPNDNVRVTVLDEFPNTDPIPAGEWFLRLGPQATLDPTAKEPVGAVITLVAGPSSKPTFRAADVGKFIKIYAGLVKVTEIVNVFTVKGEILAVMTGTSDSNPAAAPAGAWSLEVASWSPTTGFPGTGEFAQGRLWQARTIAQKTTFWGSDSDGFDKYSIGLEASRAIEYTLATRGFNAIQWIAENTDLFLGTAGTEQRATSGKTDEPFGGDIIPLVRGFGRQGSANIQPVVLQRRVIFVERSRRQIYTIAFDLEQDGYEPLEITGAAEHITKSRIRLGPIAVQLRLDPRIYFITESGTLVALTYHSREKVIGFTRIVTDGTFEAVAVIPGRENDQIYVIIKRVINGNVKKYVEVMEDDADELDARLWTSCQTDAAKVYNFNGVPTTILTGLEHLEGKFVDIVIDGSQRASQFVLNGRVVLAEPGVYNGEVGIHYNSTLRTMRPSLKDQQVEGLYRNWTKLWARLDKSIGGQLNGQQINYPPSDLGTLSLYTGDIDVYGYPDTSGLDGRITIVQDKPYPMTVLALYGEIQFGDHG